MTNRLIELTLSTYKTSGIRVTMIKVFSSCVFQVKNRLSPKQRYRKKNYENMLQINNSENRFDYIYKHGLWGSDESASGTGSTIDYTANIRKELPRLFAEFNIRSIFDAPCGDFNWMRLVMENQPTIHYTGADIVSDVIFKNNNKFSQENIKFVKLDVVKDMLIQCDLIIVRDFLLHLSFEDIELFIKNLLKSRIKYLLVTTHVTHRDHVNADIETGHFRVIDLFKAPLNFPLDVEFEIDDWLPPEHEKKMVLFDIDSLRKNQRSYGFSQSEHPNLTVA